METSMTRKIGLIIIAIFLILDATQARLIGTISTNARGGIMGNETTIKPLIAFKGEEPIFSNFTISPGDEGMTFTLTSDIDDPNFSRFIKKLTNTHDEYLKVGHKIGMIKSDMGSLESSWFEQKSQFEGKNITRIELTYTKLEFSKPITNIKNIDWTDFHYEVRLAFYDDTTPDVITSPSTFDDSSFEEVEGFIYKGAEEEEELDEETKLDATEDYMIVVNKRRPKSATKQTLTENQVKMVLRAFLAQWNYAF